VIASHRNAFNRTYREERYAEFVAALTARCGVPIGFRLSETPCFFPASVIDRLATEARALIAQLLTSAAYRRAADAIVPERFRIAGGERTPTFIQVDFGLVRTDAGIEGRLVELQAFPSLYGFQLALAETARDTWALHDLSIFPGSLDRATYLRTVGRAIRSDYDPAEVVLMEIDPIHQKTLPDFTLTEQLWGVRTVDVRSVIREGRRLYHDLDGRRLPIRRVYNRVIPDDLDRRGVELAFDYRDDLDVEWAGGPDWFFRISKFSLPWLEHPWVPKTMFLPDALDAGLPPASSREGWLLKPLFSYAGGGIVFSPSEAELSAIPAADRQLYVLQERVSFTPVIETPVGATHAEIRLMFVDTGDANYAFVLPLVRMGRGKMMGVDHNKGLSFVGAAAALISTGS
jgi:hypothetical protein